MSRSQHPGVIIIVPCRNEVDHIGPFLESLVPQLDLPDGTGVEVIIADGMSEDGTRERIRQIAASDPRIRLIDNPGRIQAAGLNLAIKQARGDIIVRMDVHSIYADDYVQKCVDTLKSTRADNVGGAVRPIGRGYLQEAIAIAYGSSFSSGGARFHKEDNEGFVDTVTYGCWRKETLEDMGLFDEELIRNEDDELNLRITRSGGKIWQSRAIRSWYYPRKTLRSLFSQYSQYGYWKVRVIQKHNIPASIRHVIPGLFVASLMILLLLSPFHHLFAWGFLLLGSLYLFATILASIATCRQRSRLKYLLVMPLIFATFHFAYGYGFLRGIVSFWLRRRKDHSSFSGLTRG